MLQYAVAALVFCRLPFPHIYVLCNILGFHRGALVITPSSWSSCYLCFKGTCCLRKEDGEAHGLLRTLITTDQTAWYYNPEDNTVNMYKLFQVHAS